VRLQPPLRLAPKGLPFRIPHSAFCICMHYRPLTPDDAERHVAIESYAFGGGDHGPPDAAELASYRGLFVDGALAAQLRLIPLRISAGRDEVAGAGIGGVASPPELRRRGYVAALLRHLADELRAGGVPLAILYPFKRPFYARYGWATFFERRIYQGSPERFASFKHDTGRFVPAGPADIAELDHIYRRALHGRFGLVARDEAWWRERVLQLGERQPWHAYIWRDEQGHGRSYLVFRLQHEGGQDRLFCREIAALDPVARAQLFAFFAMHQDQVQLVRFPAPADAPVNLLLPEPVECTVEPHFMLRLLDVPAAIEAYPFPRGAEGRLTLGVTDAWIAENQGVFELELAQGRCQVRRLPDGAPTDLRCDVGTLAQLYSRYLGPRTAVAFGVLGAESRAAVDLAERAFAGLAPFSTDFF
jgi:predicted acetyltransferase